MTNRAAKWSDIGAKKAVTETVPLAAKYMGESATNLAKAVPNVPGAVSQAAGAEFRKEKNKTVVQLYARRSGIKGSGDLFLCNGSNGITAATIASKIAIAFKAL